MRAKDLILYNLIPYNKEEFGNKVIDIANKLGTNANDLMTVMYFESKLKADAKNPYGSATGLLQFTESTANDLGTTTAQLKGMSNVQQLDYVYRYLKPYTGKLTSLSKLYLAVFYPSAISKSADYQFPLSERWVTANKIFDVNKDGKITVSEIISKLRSFSDYLAHKFFGIVTTDVALPLIAIATFFF